MVSIIIPCYNVAQYLPITIESVLNQTDPNWEIIAVDDGSTDNTAEVIRKYSEVDHRIELISKSNGGVSSARNTGIKYAKGEWIYFLDGDDLIENRLVETINSQSAQTELVVFEFSIDSHSKIEYRKLKKTSTLFKDYLTNKQSIHISSIAMRRIFVERNSLCFDEQTYYGEDREFIAKIFALSPSFICINKFLFRYQVREGSAMTSHIYNTRRFSSVLASERTYKNLIGTPEEKKALAVLGFTIARHLKMFYQYDSVVPALEDSLIKYKDKYLKGFHYYGVGRIELYTTIAGVVALQDSFFKWYLQLF